MQSWIWRFVWEQSSKHTSTCCSELLSSFSLLSLFLLWHVLPSNTDRPVKKPPECSFLPSFVTLASQWWKQAKQVKKNGCSEQKNRRQPSMAIRVTMESSLCPLRVLQQCIPAHFDPPRLSLSLSLVTSLSWLLRSHSLTVRRQLPTFVQCVFANKTNLSSLPQHAQLERDYNFHLVKPLTSKT